MSGHNYFANLISQTADLLRDSFWSLCAKRPQDNFASCLPTFDTCHARQKYSEARVARQGSVRMELPLQK